MMKKVLLALMILAVIFVFIACDSDTTGGSSESNTSGGELPPVMTDEELAAFEDTSKVSGTVDLGDDEKTLLEQIFNEVLGCKPTLLTTNGMDSDVFVSVGNGFSVKQYINSTNMSGAGSVDALIKDSSGTTSTVSYEWFEDGRLNVKWKDQTYNVTKQTSDTLPSDFLSFVNAVNVANLREQDTATFLGNLVHKRTGESANCLFTTLRKEKGDNCSVVMIVDIKIGNNTIYARAKSEDRESFAEEIIYVSPSYDLAEWDFMEFRINGTAYTLESVEAFFKNTQV